MPILICRVGRIVTAGHDLRCPYVSVLRTHASAHFLEELIPQT